MSLKPPLLDNGARLSAPAALLPYQQDWVADHSQLKIAEKSRRIGLTWAEAADDVMIAAAAKSAGGQNVYYIGYNQDMTVEFIEACGLWARQFNQAAGEIEEEIIRDADKDIKTYSIKFPNSGHRITALSSRPSNLRGKQGVVVIDEAAFHEDLAGLIKAALALLIWGGQVRIISTHNGDGNPFNELINEVRADKRSGTVHRTSFKEAVEQGLYKRVCLRRGIEYSKEAEQAWVDEVYKFYGDDADEELDVIPSKGSGRWLSGALLEKVSAGKPKAQVVTFDAPQGFETWTEGARQSEVDAFFTEKLEPLLELLPRNNKSFYGLDFARKRDACVFWPQLERSNLERWCPFVLEMRATPYKEQEYLLIKIVDALPRFSGAAHDAGGNGGYLAEAMQIKYGEDRVQAVMFSESWYREHTPHFKQCLEDGVIVNMPAHQDVLDDHRAFVKINGVARIPNKRTKGKDGNMRHGDSAIAHLLCDFASRSPAAEIEWTPVPGRGSDDARESHGMFEQEGCW